MYHLATEQKVPYKAKQRIVAAHYAHHGGVNHTPNLMAVLHAEFLQMVTKIEELLRQGWKGKWLERFRYGGEADKEGDKYELKGVLGWL